MSKYINEAKKGAKFLPVKNQVEYLTSQLNEESEVFNPALKKLVCEAVKFSAFSIKLIDLQTIKVIDQETGEESEKKILVVGKAQTFDRTSGEIIESELFTSAEYNEKQQACFSTDQFLSSFYYKFSDQIEAFEEAEKKAAADKKKAEKEEADKKKKEEADKKKLEKAVELEQKKKEAREKKAAEINAKAEKMKQEARQLLQETKAADLSSELKKVKPAASKKVAK